MVMVNKKLKNFLDQKSGLYNQPAFIETDPIQIPKQFKKKEDIETSGFLAATIAWGQRPTIIKNTNRLMELMGWKPYRFILDTSEKGLRVFDGFKHRTFNAEDCKFFMLSLKNIYLNHGGLEKVFTQGFKKDGTIKSALAYFYQVFFEIEGLPRTRKHVSNVVVGSAAKRLNMYLRWMVRKDRQGIDFGLWKEIPMAKLMLPLDVHTGNISRKLGILTRKQNDWKAVEEVTAVLKKFDPYDPVKYDYALFGLGAFEKF